MGLWLSFPGFQVVGKAQRIVSSKKKVKGVGVGREAEVTLLSSSPPPPPLSSLQWPSNTRINFKISIERANLHLTFMSFIGRFTEISLFSVCILKKKKRDLGKR